MTEKDFEKALNAVFNEECSAIENDEIPQYEFSPRFEKRMNRIIGRKRRPSLHNFRKNLLRSFACAVSAAAVVFFVAKPSDYQFQGDSTRLHILNFYIELNNNGTDYEFRMDIPDKDAPYIIEELYEITYDLNDYKLDWDSTIYSWYDINNATDYSCLFINDERDLYYEQRVKQGYDVCLNTEGAEFEVVNIGDKKAVYFKNHINVTYLLWEDDDYIFLLNSAGINNHRPFVKSELIDIANSVQKIEK